MSFHFTQSCAFIAYSFRFLDYCLCFIGAKIHNFSKVQGFGAFFIDLCFDTGCSQLNKPLGINHYTRDSPKYRLPN